MLVLTGLRPCRQQPPGPHSQVMLCTSAACLEGVSSGRSSRGTGLGNRWISPSLGVRRVWDWSGTLETLGVPPRNLSSLLHSYPLFNMLLPSHMDTMYCNYTCGFMCSYVPVPPSNVKTE